MKKTLFILSLLSFISFAGYSQEKDDYQAIKSFLKDVGTNLSEGFNELTDELGEISDKIEESSTVKVVTIYGKVRSKKIDGNVSLVIKSSEGNLYKIKTFSGTEASMKKLEEFKNKNIKATGFLNLDENLFTVTSYELYK